MIGRLRKFLEGDDEDSRPQQHPEPEPEPDSSFSGWPLSMPLLEFQTLHGNQPVEIPWSIADACEGFQVFGGTGSGKTSGSGRTLAMSMLHAGFGGLVLCAKPEEADAWVSYLEEAGRLSDAYIFSPEAKSGFNFLEYELAREGRGSGNTQDIINLLMQCADVSGSDNSGGGDDVWVSAMKQLLGNCLDLQRIAGEPVTMKELYRLPSDPDRVAELVAKARDRELSRDDAEDLEMVERFFKGDWDKRADRTRSSVLMNLAQVAEPFLRGRARDLLCQGTTVTPEDAFAGKVVIVDLPIKEFGTLGRYAAVIWKYLFQRAAERRAPTSDADRPLFIYADESQFFVTRTDAEFQTTARSARVVTCYLTQNLPNYHMMVGASGRERAAVDSMLGNLQTKIFHQNSCTETNKWGSETVSRSWQEKTSSTVNVSFEDGGSSGTSTQKSLEFEIQPAEFLNLGKGGPDFGFVVTGILFKGGKVMPNGKNWTPVAFPQKPRG